MLVHNDSVEDARKEIDRLQDAIVTAQDKVDSIRRSSLRQSKGGRGLPQYSTEGTESHIRELQEQLRRAIQLLRSLE